MDKSREIAKLEKWIYPLDERVSHGKGISTFRENDGFKLSFDNDLYLYLYMH